MRVGTALRGAVPLYDNIMCTEKRNKIIYYVRGKKPVLFIFCNTFLLSYAIIKYACTGVRLLFGVNNNLLIYEQKLST